MRRLLFVSVVIVSAVSGAQAPPERKESKDLELKKKEINIAPDKSLAGDITRKKKKEEIAPALTYDAFRLNLEGQVASKRREQIEDLKKIIELSPDPKEKPNLLFRLGELYWEESKYFFFEANRKDDDKIRALNTDDKAGVERAEAEKKELSDKSHSFAQKAVEQYSRIVQEFKDFERTDEVLYFLGLNLFEMGDEKRGLVAYNRLISKYQKSHYLPDSYLAVAEHYFNNSKGKRDYLEKALENYKAAAKFPENAVYGYALYKQGWCYFNMNDFDKAMDQFKAVVLYADFAGDKEVEGAPGKGGKSNRAGLAREARNDFVRAYSRGGGTPNDAKDKFSKLAKTPDDLRLMMKQLANLLYEDGKDREAAVTYNMLILERPISPEAPGFQSRVIDCVMRAGNKKMTVQQVRRLVKIMDDVLTKNPKLDDKDKKSLDEAKELAERTISNLAVSWHNEAKKTRDDDTFGLANDVYSDYLTLFPDSPKSYDLRFFYATLLSDNLNKFDKAAEEYTKVVLADVKKVDSNQKPGKYFFDAAYASILAWDEVVKKGTFAPVPVGPPAPIPLEKKNLVDACERYLKYVEKGEKKVEIAYKVARVYYDYNHLDEAIPRYTDIALKYPDYKSENGDRVGESAANQVLDSYNLLKDWQKLNESARKFYASDKLAVGKFREELATYIEQSSFKLINQLEANKEYQKAAEAYLAFVSEWSKSELADQALFNASIDFYNAKMLDKAIEVRKQIIQKYPKSKFVPEAMYALAEGYEAITDFDSAADYYEKYVAQYEKSRGPAGKKGAPKAAPKKAAAKDGKGKDAPEQLWVEGKAQDALFNAGIFRDGLGQYKQALRNREKYLELWPDSKDAEAVTKSIIDLYEKTNQWAKAQKDYEEYEHKFLKDPSKVLWAEGRIATIYEEKLKSGPNARRIYKRITDYYGQLGKKQREALEIQALDAVARASFAGNEDDFKKYSAMKLRWSSMQNIGELKATIASKANALKQINDSYTATIKLKSADPAICALYKIGLAFDQFADAVINFPVPKGMPEEVLVEARPQFEQQAQDPKNNAAAFFTAVVEKSRELDVFNPCTTAALEMLRTKYKPEQFPAMKEDVLELKFDPAKQMAIGAGVLTAIQPVPVVSPEKAAALRNQARDLGSNVAEVGSAPPPDRDDPAPAPRSSKSNGVKSAPAAAVKGAPKTPPKKDSDEPEEPL